MSYFLSREQTKGETWLFLISISLETSCVDILGIWFLQNIKLFFQRSRTLDRPHDSGDILSYAIIILCLKNLFKTDVGIYYEIIDAS